MGRVAFLAGFVGWVIAFAGAVLIEPSDARTYATFWTGAVAAVGTVFVFGFLLFSRPAKDANGRREWVGEWYWLVALPGLIMLVYGNQFIFRLIIPAPDNPTNEQVLAQRFAAVIAATVFFLLLWLTAMWVRRRVRVRRELRDDQLDYRNGWPPSA